MKIDEHLAASLPDPDEQAIYARVTRNILDAINEAIGSLNIDARPVLVGSVAKGTNLKGSDIDIFIAFSRKYNEKEIENYGLRIGRSVLDPAMERFAEHPYVYGYVDGIKVDIVPCFDIMPGETKISSVDRTLLHTDYVNMNLDNTGKNEVRKLKVFFRSAGIYGSDVVTSGFSGYICELLILNFGSFDETVTYFSTLKGRLLIPPDSGRKFPDATAVVIDPTDNNRNAGAAISAEALSRAKIASKLYLEEGMECFRKSGKIPVDPVIRNTAFRVISFPRPDVSDDIVYTQLVRVSKKVSSLAAEAGFNILGTRIRLSESRMLILLEFDRARVHSVVRHMGPPVENPNAIDFVKKWRDAARLRGPYISGDRIYVETKPKFTEIDDFLSIILGHFSLGATLERLRKMMEIDDPVGKRKYHRILEEYLSEGLFG
ncbi:MAG: CCA tRNA nucleotidyltransferase [Candidatus Thermoplasmatota archaeon]|nr:CCA tRNA nucleotidyltransferase [Candidatus Thermoplasmatota archaeon]MCL5731479.1 CCA tRNA nucleotidyltransferase [Candidatus Thermoplasmatota archaeon]